MSLEEDVWIVFALGILFADFSLADQGELNGADRWEEKVLGSIRSGRNECN